MIRSALPLLLLTACAGRQAETSLPDTAEEEVVPTGPSARTTADALEVTLTIDAERYTAKANTIRCVTEPCPSNAEPAVAHAAIEVRNEADAPRTLEFTSGQRFNLVLLDAEGEIVRDWSADKLFMMATDSLTLAPGDAESWLADITVADGAGELAGDYVLQGYVLGHGPKVEIPFTVELEGQ